VGCWRQIACPEGPGNLQRLLGPWSGFGQAAWKGPGRPERADRGLLCANCLQPSDARYWQPASALRAPAGYVPSESTPRQRSPRRRTGRVLLLCSARLRYALGQLVPLTGPRALAATGRKAPSPWQFVYGGGAGQPAPPPPSWPQRFEGAAGHQRATPCPLPARTGPAAPRWNHWGSNRAARSTGASSGTLAWKPVAQSTGDLLVQPAWPFQPRPGPSHSSGPKPRRLQRFAQGLRSDCPPAPHQRRRWLAQAGGTAGREANPINEFPCSQAATPWRRTSAVSRLTATTRQRRLPHQAHSHGSPHSARLQRD